MKIIKDSVLFKSIKGNIKFIFYHVPSLCKTIYSQILESINDIYTRSKDLKKSNYDLLDKYIGMGYFRDALIRSFMLEKIFRLDNPVISFSKGYSHFMLGNYSKSINELNKYILSKHDTYKKDAEFCIKLASTEKIANAKLPQHIFVMNKSHAIASIYENIKISIFSIISHKLFYQNDYITHKSIVSIIRKFIAQEFDGKLDILRYSIMDLECSYAMLGMRLRGRLSSHIGFLLGTDSRYEEVKKILNMHNPIKSSNINSTTDTENNYEEICKYYEILDNNNLSISYSKFIEIKKEMIDTEAAENFKKLSIVSKKKQDIEIIGKKDVSIFLLCDVITYDYDAISIIKESAKIIPKDAYFILTFRTQKNISKFAYHRKWHYLYNQQFIKEVILDYGMKVVYSEKIIYDGLIDNAKNQNYETIVFILKVKK